MKTIGKPGWNSFAEAWFIKEDDPHVWCAHPTIDERGKNIINKIKKSGALKDWELKLLQEFMIPPYSIKQSIWEAPPGWCPYKKEHKQGNTAWVEWEDTLG